MTFLNTIRPQLVLLLATWGCVSVTGFASIGVPATVLSRQLSKASEASVRRPSSGILSKRRKSRRYAHDGQFEPSWRLQNDFYTFLNQCSIQSFMFLLKSMRDPQTLLWLEGFSQPSISDEDVQDENKDPRVETNGPFERSRLLHYHGLAAIDTTIFPTWDSYFTQLLDEPESTFIVESGVPQIPDYELEINPANLCRRLLSVREQIAREFVIDLDVIAKMGPSTLASFWESQEKQTEFAESGETVKMKRGDLQFLGYSTDASNTVCAASPLRKGNWDLLLLLATQEAIHRILNDPARQREGSTEKAVNDFLQDFYASRLFSHFLKSVKYSRADDFIEELLSAQPVVIQTGSFPDFDADVPLNEIQIVPAMTMLDPVHVAELVLMEREQVALEWRDLARLVPEEHLEVRRIQLSQVVTQQGTLEDFLRAEATMEEDGSLTHMASASIPFLGANATSIFE